MMTSKIRALGFALPPLLISPSVRNSAKQRILSTKFDNPSCVARVSLSSSPQRHAIIQSSPSRRLVHSYNFRAHTFICSMSFGNLATNMMGPHLISLRIMASDEFVWLYYFMPPSSKSLRCTFYTLPEVRSVKVAGIVLCSKTYAYCGQWSWVSLSEQ